MKKTLIALAVLGAAAGVAHAQSNVTIYGVVDTGFIKKSGHDIEMGENVNNRLGFRGVEDLGGGMKATFELERRFNLNDGTLKKSDKDWDGAANVGLKGDSWGAVRLGRVNELTTETIRKFDPFYQYGVGAMLEGNQRSPRIDNTIRYDSPNWSGFKFGASYSLGGNTDRDSIDGVAYKEDGSKDYTGMAAVKDAGADNDGYAIMLGYDNGPLALVGNWSRLADSKKSSVWNLGAAYRFGDAKVELVYQQTKDKGWANGKQADWQTVSSWNNGRVDNEYNGVDELKEKQWLLGLEWKLGPGRLNASAQWMEVEASGGKHVSDKDIYKYAIGYTYDLSKRTAIYGNVAYTDYDDEEVAAVYGDTDDGTYGVQVGITHKF
ncbi:porin [Oxalobacter aliiformigenes]|uniref:porin n=1 Tax=Oxalobacter aliiformigenes TaxID=2946593 RepID=UPI0022AF8487|nr:porin [Oxalobacter aliiformigenes]MCZ4064319.1 porin [Oxalobacter aliiformigenes]WAV98861.1 porin [Oxalobacter aliiformigenes]